MKRIDRRLVTVLRVALGVLFLAAAWPKLVDPHGFAESVSHYRLLPVPLERLAALVLPPLELLVGVCLIFGVLDAGASALALVLLAVFTIAIAIAVARGLDISCGCFETKGGTKVGTTKILENLAMLAAALAITFGDRSWLSVSTWVKQTGDIE